MTALPTRGNLAGITAAVAMALCASVGSSVAQGAAPTAGENASLQAAIERARADSARYPYTKADIDFMKGMIHHHAQAIAMSRWAPTHGASAEIQRLAARIINAQRDEIGTMQRWLRVRNQAAPDPELDSTSMNPTMHGGMAGMHDMQGMHGIHGASGAHEADGTHEMLMPGMLTPEQMKELDSARGREFDRLFLTFMIQHHSGAVSMVKDLFGSYGAAQDELVFKFANDVNVDQTTEIARMRKMLAAVIFGDAPADGPATERQ
ncbi:MAG TPA: DUF305 domain-containing protein [Gemmatimonadaceae bacterium]|jgi:Uncharacterized protein conserved in bacteria